MQRSEYMGQGVKALTNTGTEAGARRGPKCVGERSFESQDSQTFAGCRGVNGDDTPSPFAKDSRGLSVAGSGQPTAVDTQPTAVDVNCRRLMANRRRLAVG